MSEFLGGFIVLQLSPHELDLFDFLLFEIQSNGFSNRGRLVLMSALLAEFAQYFFIDRPVARIAIIFCT